MALLYHILSMFSTMVLKIGQQSPAPDEPFSVITTIAYLGLLYGYTPANQVFNLSVFLIYCPVWAVAVLPAENLSLYITLDVVHRVVDCHPGSHRTAGAVDVQADILARILRLQKQKLRHDQACGHIRHFLTEKNNPLF